MRQIYTFMQADLTKVQMCKRTKETHRNWVYKKKIITHQSNKQNKKVVFQEYEQMVRENQFPVVKSRMLFVCNEAIEEYYFFYLVRY